MMFHHLSGSATKSCVERSMLRCLSPNSFSLVICVRIKITSISVCRPKREQRLLSEFRAAVDSFIQRLRSNKGFTAALVTHPWLRSPNNHVEEILDNPQYRSEERRVGKESRSRIWREADREEETAG